MKIAIFLYMPFSLYWSFYVTCNVENDRPKIHTLRTLDANAKNVWDLNNDQEIEDSIVPSVPYR